ncbi:MAG: methyltransferase family protein [Anaerolineales bacterium]
MNTETLMRLLAFVLVLGAFSISGYFRGKADRSDKPMDFGAENKWHLRLRNAGALIFYLSMLAYLVYPPLIAWANLDWPVALRWVGLALMALLLPLLYWMFASLGGNITPTVKTRRRHQLVQNGPYRYIRHPLYTFGSLFFLGFCLLAGNWLMMIGAVTGLTGLSFRTPLEEGMLVKKFGKEYQDYMARTGRYLPKLG